MAYEKQNFEDGQILTAEALNHIEDGVVKAVGTIPKGDGVVRFTDTGIVIDYVRQEGTDEIDTSKYPIAFTGDSGEGPIYYATLYTGDLLNEFNAYHFVVTIEGGVVTTKGLAKGEETVYVRYPDGQNEFAGFHVYLRETQHTNYDGTTTTIQPGIYLETYYNPKFYEPSFTCSVYEISAIEPPYLSSRIAYCGGAPEEEDNGKVLAAWYGRYQNWRPSSLTFEEGIKVLSSTEGSQKRFIITVDDNGEITATEA